MNILGISGLNGAAAFKMARWPGLDIREYRISQGHDSAAALVIDGKVVAAAAEERFTRRKHTGEFPIRATEYCLAEAGLKLADVHELAHGFDYSAYRRLICSDPNGAALYHDVLSREALLAQIAKHFPEFPAERVHHVNHHLAHASSAYFTSGWDECLTVVLDGMGEAHSGSFYHARDGKLELLHQIAAAKSIGILYSLVTLHLGFDFNSDEYKIMGLAPYGNADRYRPFFDAAVQLEGGAVRIPLLALNRTPREKETYLASRAYLSEHLIEERRPEQPVTADHQDVAAALQACLDRVMLGLCGHYGERSGLRKLALAGGVALNCTANGKLLRSGRFDDIYIQPAAGDDGTAIGAALYRASLAKEIDKRRSPVPFFGPAYSRKVIDDALREFDGQVEVTRFDELAETCAVAARLVAEGRVIAWYRGRMEFGPRALGHRSILADPGHPEMRDRINAMVKMREAFRPFAPAVTLETAHRWFDIPAGAELPYMILIVEVREEFRATLPAVTHVDGTARVQTVTAHDNPEFHALLRAVGVTTMREMLLNTSFNVKGQPIVNTPREAIETYLRTGIDHLFLDDTLVSRRAEH